MKAIKNLLAKLTPKTAKGRKRRNILIAVLIILALLFVFVVRPILSASQQLTNALYTPAAVERRDLTVSVNGTAAVEPADSYRVSALVKGEILDAPFEEGDTVEKDDVLFTFDSSDVQTSIQRAQLSVDRAQLTYDDALDVVEITANGSGVVQTLYVEEGDTVTAGMAVADIVDRDTVTLKVPFHSQAAQQFTVGQTAQLTVDGYADRLTGTVTEISGADTVGDGGALVRTVTIEAANPGAITSASTGTATVGGYACAASGTYAYRTEKTVTASATGDVSALSVREGDRVSKDQVLCTLESATSVESARLSLEDARLSLQSAVDSLDDYTITSPISGTVIEKNYKAGDTVDAAAAGEYLAVIYDLSYLKFEMQVDEVNIGKIQVGQEVSITADALEGQSFTGRVSKVNINGTTAGGVTSYPVTVIIDEPGDLLPGMNISADILVEQVENALVVPVGAVARGNTVLIPGPGAIGKDGSIDPSKLEQVQVTLGANDDSYIQITSDNLAEGDTVIIEQSFTTIWDTMMSMGGGQPAAGMG